MDSVGVSIPSYNQIDHSASTLIGGASPASPASYAGGEPGGLPHYKDFLAKSSGEHYFALLKEYRAVAACGNTAVEGQCLGSDAHKFLKVLRCGREWCQTCGHRGSDTHMRRYSRIIPKVRQMSSMGYFVLQWPLAERDGLRDKASLSRMGIKVAKLFKALGYDRGIRSWDWFGDPKCPWCGYAGKLQNWRDQSQSLYVCARGHEFMLSEVRAGDMRWNPHLNILVDGQYLTKDKLQAVKDFLRVRLGSDSLIVNYSYVSESDEARIPKMLHHARYSVKPTFLRWDWEPGMLLELRGIRSTFYWGHWDGPAAWDIPVVDDAEFALTDVVALQSGSCPECSGSIRWGGVSFLGNLGLRGFVPVGAGYFMFVGSDPPA